MFTFLRVSACACACVCMCVCVAEQPTERKSKHTAHYTYGCGHREASGNTHKLPLRQSIASCDGKVATSQPC